MSYAAEISRVQPTAFIFVIDQSASMDESMDGGIKKSQFVADVLNKTLYQLIIRCTMADGVRDYFSVGVVSYSGNGVTSGFSALLGKDFIQPLSALEASPLRVEDRLKKVSDGAGGVLEQATKFPVWFDPVHDGGTPMCEALRKTAEICADWCNANTSSYPPTIIHVTDGQSTDGNPEPIASQLRQISTDDGEVLLFNLHVDTAPGSEVIFPSEESALPDPYSKMLFRMSSVIPNHLIGGASERGHKATGKSRFFGYRAGAETIVDFFAIGTRASQMR